MQELYRYEKTEKKYNKMIGIAMTSVIFLPTYLPHFYNMINFIINDINLKNKNKLH